MRLASLGADLDGDASGLKHEELICDYHQLPIMTTKIWTFVECLGTIFCSSSSSNKILGEIGEVLASVGENDVNGSRLLRGSIERECFRRCSLLIRLSLVFLHVDDDNFLKIGFFTNLVFCLVTTLTERTTQAGAAETTRQCSITTKFYSEMCVSVLGFLLRKIAKNDANNNIPWKVSERALMKTRILAISEMASDIISTSTSNSHYIIPLNSYSFDSLHSFCTCFIKNAPRFARRRRKSWISSRGAWCTSTLT